MFSEGGWHLEGLEGNLISSMTVYVVQFFFLFLFAALSYRITGCCGREAEDVAQERLEQAGTALLFFLSF